MVGGLGGHGSSTLFEILEFLEILMVRWKISALLLLVKIRALNFIGKSLNLAPSSTLQVP